MWHFHVVIKFTVESSGSCVYIYDTLVCPCLCTFFPPPKTIATFPLLACKWRSVAWTCMHFQGLAWACMHTCMNFHALESTCMYQNAFACNVPSVAWLIYTHLGTKKSYIRSYTRVWVRLIFLIFWAASLGWTSAVLPQHLPPHREYHAPVPFSQ